MLKRITMVLLFMGVSLLNFRAQGIAVTNAKLLKPVTSSELSVIIPENNYGKILKEIVAKHWTITAYKFISEKDVETLEDKAKVNLLGQFKGTFIAQDYELDNISFFGIVNKYSAKGEYSYQKKNIAAHVVFPLDHIVAADLKTILTLNIKSLQRLIETQGVNRWNIEMMELKKEVLDRKVVVCATDLDGTFDGLDEIYEGEIEVVDKLSYEKLIQTDEEALFLMSLKDDAKYNYHALLSSVGVVYWSDITYSDSKKEWDKAFLHRFFLQF